MMIEKGMMDWNWSNIDDGAKCEDWYDFQELHIDENL